MHAQAYNAKQFAVLKKEEAQKNAGVFICNTKKNVDQKIHDVNSNVQTQFKNLGDPQWREARFDDVKVFF